MAVMNILEYVLHSVHPSIALRIHMAIEELAKQGTMSDHACIAHLNAIILKSGSISSPEIVTADCMLL